MSNSIKNYLGIAGIIAILVFAYGVLSFSGTFRDLTPTNASFSVSGEGKVVAVPDIATFSYGVISEGGMDITKLQDDNSKKGNAIIEMMKKQGGVATKDIKTSSYNISPRYTECNSWITKNPCPPATIVGYTVSQNVTVKIRDFSKISGLLGGVAKLGANNVSSLSFGVDEPESLKAEARAEAIKKAKEKAAVMAKNAGFSVGRLLEISEGSPRNYYDYYSYAPSVAMGTKAEAAPTIEAGSQDVNVTVTLKYEIR